MALKWFGSSAKPDLTGHLVGLLERLVQLYELDLAARGITTRTAEEEGEIFEFSSKSEEDDERRAFFGLPAGAYPYPVDPEGKPWSGVPEAAGRERLGPPTQAADEERLFGSWSLSVGPEGAEAPERGTPEGRND